MHRSAVSTGGYSSATVLHYAAYLSHWSISFTAIVFTIIACRPSGSRIWWWVGQTAIINVAMSIGYWGSASWLLFVEQPVFLQFAHGILPGLVIFYWLVFTDHGHVTLADSVIWLALPLVYTSWMESYGLMSGFYPYWQLDPLSQGRLHVILSVADILILSGVVSRALFLLDKYILPRSASLAHPLPEDADRHAGDA